MNNLSNQNGGGGGGGGGIGGASSSRNTGASSAYNDFLEQDFPASFFNEEFQDWSDCRPSDRQSFVTDIGGGRFSVTVPDEPVIWIFCRKSEAQQKALVYIYNIILIYSIF